MTKTIRVDDWFHEWLDVERRDEETIQEALVRLTGVRGPDPEAVSGVISREDGERMKSRIAELNASPGSEK